MGFGREKTNRRARAEKPFYGRFANEWGALAFWETSAIAAAENTTCKTKADPD